MSQPLKPGPNWRHQADRIAAASEVIGRYTGMRLADILAAFADPPPHYGDPVAEFRRDPRASRVIRREAVTAAELEAERRAEERYQEAVGRIRRRYGLAKARSDVAA